MIFLASLNELDRLGRTRKEDPLIARRVSFEMGMVGARGKHPV
jgi:hypothetical protein